LLTCGLLHFAATLFRYSFGLRYNENMKVTFTRTGKWRYRVSVVGPGLEPMYMEPAAGYNEKLPHDAAHFIVENELCIRGGIFGQIAAGGTGGTFQAEELKKRRKTRKRGKKLSTANRDDAQFSEHAIYAAQSRWKQAQIQPDTKIPESDIARICARFDEFSSKWCNLPVGGSVTLEWRPSVKSKSKGR